MLYTFVYAFRGFVKLKCYFIQNSQASFVKSKFILYILFFLEEERLNIDIDRGGLERNRIYCHLCI